jgi:cytochrome c5
MRVNAKKAFVIACGSAAALVAVGVTSLVVSRPAAATAQFAKDTGKTCGDCHTNPKGGGALTPLGEKFKANGNKMPKPM